MTKKSCLKSKTLWFNLALAVFTVVSTHSELLRGFMSDGGYLGVLVLISVINTGLRFMTHEGIKL